MKLSISADIELKTPGTKGGYVTWLDVRLGDADRTYGVARVAIVHVGEIADAHGDLWPALRGTRLEALHDVYFVDGWYKDDFADGAGIDLLYVESIELDESARNKNLDIAMVNRLAQTIRDGSSALGAARLRRDDRGPRCRLHASQARLPLERHDRGERRRRAELRVRPLERPERQPLQLIF